MAGIHVAQINIGRLVAPTDDPAVADFMAALDRVNAVADAAPGFVWRLQTEAGNATDIHVFPDPLELVNVSVWESIDALRDYVYRSEHVDFFRRRSEWFVPEATRVALWWVRAGSIPDLADAIRRAEFLRRVGASPYAFGFAHPPRPVVVERTVDADECGDADILVRATTEDDDVLGVATVVHLGDGTGELTTLTVQDTVREEHLDAALVDQALLAAGQRGWHELQLDADRHAPTTVSAAVGLGFTRLVPPANATGRGHRYHTMLGAPD